ncbi:uncharacterized protein LOC144449030 [Glandiceps talaboti]
MAEGGATKGLGTILIVFGGLSVIFGVVSIPVCVSDAKYLGAPIWSGFFVVLTGAIGLMSGYRPKSGSWMTAFLVMSVLGIMIVFAAWIATVVGIVKDSHGLNNDYTYYHDEYELSWYEDRDEKDETNDELMEFLGDHLNLNLPEDFDTGELEDMFHEFMENEEWPEDFDIGEEEVDEVNEWLHDNIGDDVNLPEDFDGDDIEELVDILTEHFEEDEEDDDDGDDDDDDDDDDERDGETRHRQHGDHDGDRPRPDGHDEADWMDYDNDPWFDDNDSKKKHGDDYEDSWGKHEDYDSEWNDYQTSIALFSVSMVLAFIELILVFSAAISACCGLCTPSTRVGTLPHTFILQPGQQIIPGSNGQFVFVQAGYGQHSLFHGVPSAPPPNFTPSTNPALTMAPSGPPQGRLPPLTEKPATPAPAYEEAVELPTKISL